MRFLSPTVATLLLVACSAEQDDAPATGAQEAPAPAVSWDLPQDSSDRIATVSGFSGPEAVRYVPAEDVYFVSNFNGDGGERDANGFLSRVSPDGVVEALRFMTGTEEHPLHAPRGMNVTGDTLWVADVDGVHGFSVATGQHLAFIDFTAHEPGFLNDIAAGPDGELYVTDTGRSRIYRAEGGEVSVLAELPEDGPPNGITLGPDGRLLTAAWGGGHVSYAVDPATGSVEPWAESSGGYFDGLELVGSGALLASQADSSLHLIEDGTGRPYVRVDGAPADIGLDTRRQRVAVPYIALDRVDIWQLPTG